MKKRLKSSKKMKTLSRYDTSNKNQYQVLVEMIGLINLCCLDYCSYELYKDIKRICRKMEAEGELDDEFKVLYKTLKNWSYLNKSALLYPINSSTKNISQYYDYLQEYKDFNVEEFENFIYNIRLVYDEFSNYEYLKEYYDL